MCIRDRSIAVTRDGEAASVEHYLDENKIAEEAMYDGLYAVCTDLLDDEVSDILKVSEGRWQIEEYCLLYTSITSISTVPCAAW